MPIYDVRSAALGRDLIRHWRLRVARTFGLLFVCLVLCAAGLFALDASNRPVRDRAFTAVWNASNLFSTLGDFNGLDDREKAFLIGTMLVFIAVGGYALTSLSGLLTSVPALAYRENRRVQRQLDQLSNHVVVIGFGPLGQLVARKLRDAGDTVIVVDRDAELAALASAQSFHVLQADAGEDDAAFAQVGGLDRARGLVVTTEDQDRKLAITLMAHALNPNIKIAVTGANTRRGALLRKAGASEVVIAEDLIAEALVGRLTRAPGG